MFCPYCGNEINDTASICPHCEGNIEAIASSQGGIYTNATVSNNNHIKKKRKKKHGLLKTALVLVLVLAIGFGGYKGWGFAKRNDLLPISDSPKKLNDAAVSVAMSNLKALVVETADYIHNYPIGGVETDITAATDALQEYRTKFYQIDGLPENVQQAAEEMYTLMYMSYRNSRDANTYVRSLSNVEAAAKEEEDSDELTIDDHFNYLETFSTDLREAYEGIKVIPPFFRLEHDQLGQSLDLTDNCISYMKDSWNNNNVLDFYGSINRFNHIWTDMNSSMEYYYNSIEDQVSFYIQQRDRAYAIYQEFKVVFEMTDPSDIAAYEFKNVGKNDLQFEYDTISTIYPSLYNSYRYFVRVQIGCISGEKDVVVECQINGLTEKYKETLHVSDSLGLYAIKPLPDLMDSNIDVARDAQISIALTETDGTLIDVQTFPVHVASKNDFNWEDNEFGFINKDNILCFMTPEADAIYDLKAAAEEELALITGGDMDSFSAEAPEVFDDITDGYFYATAAMMALSDSGVRYNMDGFSIDGKSQHILLPEEVLESKSGLCIETTLVIASLFKNAGFKTFIILPPGHAQVAIETREGSGHYFLIETTMLPCTEDEFAEYLGLILSDAGPENIDGQYPVMYYNFSMWVDYIVNDDIYIINCDDITELGITPFYD
ncbi:zinc ribbon domain-containing protein [Butyrivibrio proteoclasticus]|uniref:zinc ribbon domain-containing protein n=1 Tax=Butyrivibrio proteoclasticus TaxID=43305 RepID=UPI000479EAAB|nr:zinc ribbon domain-containing protein [Butyrivibrio proteoclasticus]